MQAPEKGAAKKKIERIFVEIRKNWLTNLVRYAKMQKLSDERLAGRTTAQLKKF